MESPLVSVITVCRNALSLLRITMESVASQDYFNMEYIIVDGASTDGTIDFLRQEEQSDIRWISEPDHGIYDAMNKGVAMAKGEWVILMNAGDMFVSSDVLRRIFSQHTDAADIIYGDVLKRGSDGKTQVKQAEAPHNARRMFFCHQSSLTRTRLLRDTPFDTRHRMSADFKFFKLMLQQGKVFKQVHFPIAVFDTSGVSNTKRSVGLRDNISVINEVDSLTERLRLLPSLMFTYLVCRLRGK